MAPCGNRRRSLRGLAVPLLLSLAVHGLLLLVLGLFPARSRGPTLAIEDTRVALDLCLLDPGPSANRSPRETPASPRDLNVSTDFRPQLNESPIVAGPDVVGSAPTLSFAGPLGRTDGPAGSPKDGGRVVGSLFSPPTMAARVVYVLDRSVSMGMDNKLERACQELLAGLRRLPSATRFQVVAYNNHAEPLVIHGSVDWLTAEPAVLEEVGLALARLAAAGGTDHANALRRGLALRPDVLFFVTDADDLPPEQVALVTRGNPGAVIHAIELTRRRHPRSDSSLARLARDNGGSYRCVWIGD